MKLPEQPKNIKWSIGQGVERRINLAGGGILILIAAAIVLNLLFNPMNERRRWLAKELAPISETMELREQDQQFKAWRQAIDTKPSLWDALVPPPPPPPPPPPAPPVPPDTKKMLEGVKASRMAIGAKVKIITPENEKGEFLAVGDTVKGFTVKEIQKKQVILELFWKEGNQKIVESLPRE